MTFYYLQKLEQYQELDEGQEDFLNKIDFSIKAHGAEDSKACSDLMTQKELFRSKILKEFKSEEVKISVNELLAEEEKSYLARMSGKLSTEKLYWTIFFPYKTKYVPFVLTEDKQLIQVKQFADSEEYFFEYNGELYKYSNELFFKDSYRINTISKRCLKLLESKLDKNKLYYDVLKKIKEYYDHSNPVEYSLIFPFIIVSYICWGLGRTYYLILQGKEDTGKSTLQTLFSLIQMNGWFGGKSSVPVMVRLKHFFGISANQDELEKMHKEEKINFMGVANSGFNITGTYNFVNTNKRKIAEQIQILNSFGTNSFSVNSLNLKWDFDNSFLSRCYPLIATRKNRQTKDINSLSNQERESFQELTDRLFVYCLTNYSLIERDILAVKALLEKEGIFGRRTDLYSIILGILSHFKGDFSLEHETIRSKEGLESLEDLDTIEGAVFNYLSGKFTKTEKSISILNKDICNFVNLHLDLPDDKQLKPRTVGAILRRFNLIMREDQAKRTGEGYEYTIGLKQFADMLGRYGYKNQLEKLRELIPTLVHYVQEVQEVHNDSELNELNELNEPNSKLQKQTENPPTFTEPTVKTRKALKEQKQQDEEVPFPK